MLNQASRRTKETPCGLGPWMSTYVYNLLVVLKKLKKRYAPLTPLFVSNLLPETETFQEQTTTAVLCSDDLKQVCLLQFGNNTNYVPVLY